MFVTYMPKKPIKFGWTLFAAACARTSYIWNFYLDDGFTVTAKHIPDGKPYGGVRTLQILTHLNVMRDDCGSSQEGGSYS